ncbi:O-antigen ligase family protein [Marivirga harenae]|uniref:O-antigen ligase family protein n=1 Tax=Marivirga harenae TaxID=2010992 RepID=UPI0026E0E8C2|nr:O-antigen ligase family protein [Marivirga harenae]WKV12888.1 O-antigen ligase family protein [Marivirga harenae]
MNLVKKNISKSQVFQILILVFSAVLIPYLMVITSYLMAALVLGIIASILVLISIFWHYKAGIYILLLYSSFIFLIDRILMANIPFGIAVEVLIVLTFIALLIQQKGKESFQWKLNEPIVIIQLIFYSYFILQIANPNAVSISAWLASARFLTTFILFYIFLHFLSNLRDLKIFTRAWLIIAMMVAAYGVFQEYVGLRDFEWRWIRAVPNRYDLYFIWGHMRKFSFLSDPSAYGLFLGFTGLSALMMSFGPYSKSKKVVLICMTLFMFFAMSFAGTRTAYAMVAVGVFLFIFMNLRDPRILGISVFIVIVVTILITGPFYSAPINRMRSTLNLSEDASMNVRDIKRIRLQKYIKKNPIGGGINTAGNAGLRYSRGHPLAGRYDPDSGYLRTALEMGWIGAFLVICLNGAIVIKGISNHFRLKNPTLRTYNLMYVIPFLGLTVAHYTQDALFQKPVNLLVIATYALMVKLPDLDEEKQKPPRK